MPPREWRLRVEDIVEAVERIGRYVSGKTLPWFLADELLIDGVSHCFGIIGEAAAHMPDDVVAAHPEIPWAAMRAMRNIIVHEYFGVTVETLWKTALEDLPPLVESLKKLLAEA